MDKWKRRCQVCGKIDWYVLMEELSSNYRLFPNIKDICNTCVTPINKRVNYCGKKKEKDKVYIRNTLIKGVVAQERYSQLMFAGYY